MLTYVGQSFSSFDPQCVGVGRVQILQEISTFWWPIASSEILANLSSTHLKGMGEGICNLDVD